MDLAYGPRYEAFRDEVRGFLERHRDRWPTGAGPPRTAVLAWQKLLIERGSPTDLTVDELLKREGRWW